VSGRLLATIVDRHLRDPLRHAADCDDRCATGCGFRELDEWLSEPVLPSEIAKAKAEEERFQRLARGEFD
jgi:hypothetical protein